jgi:hypothetical protein
LHIGSANRIWTDNNELKNTFKVPFQYQLATEGRPRSLKAAIEMREEGMSQEEIEY